MTKILSKRLTTVIAEETGIQAQLKVDSIQWVEQKMFLCEVPTLFCKDTLTEAHEARQHINGPQTISLWINHSRLNSRAYQK